MAQITAGAALVARLGRLGVDCIFANSGTDFPPIIEGLAEAAAKGMALPRAVTVPHETAAVAMAHGYTLATGRAQAVMVHTNVGLANAVIGTINARADNIPMLLFSGRTPTTEAGRFGARTVPIGWGQEMSDQHALVREPCKWNYELRFPEQVQDMTDRAHGIAHSVPRGPVYLSLPREVLCETVDLPEVPAQMAPSSPMAHPGDIAEAARLIAGAQFPVIFAQRGAGSSEAFEALSATVDRWAIPVCQYWSLQLALASDHPMATGPDPAPLLAQADVVVVLEGLAPWMPDAHAPRADSTVIQIGQDPLFAQTPVRNFRSDLSLAGDLGCNVVALCAALDRLDPGDRSARRARVAATSAARWDAVDNQIAADGRGPALTKRWVSDRLARLSGDHRVTIFGELGAQLPAMRLSDPQAWFESPHSGGLGFGLPAAMGFHMARPDRLTIATVGDGSYIFANPLACLQVAKAQGLSLLVVVLNNSEWGAVRASVSGLYPEGYAVKANAVPLTDLSPSPDFAVAAQACGALGLSADSPETFETALARAVAHVTAGQGVAVIDATVLRD
ncbi:thiamine pyrophosphate-requiring protein [Mesobacterium sp. TK19101]|uniref:Thiamine pyrophosphate-requiring protein n=1 Tax=Mesobacterium hydrothermale TaxID=3111907 RepID=A0ABU6HFM3_9RHOB|nr:thiamine pyrophosphate-requiring protein [Mesobacterium sp. TK19101]MEC3861259.1 thiamine pyrophosphate-requiring protein [Mesobacterium sp. TK19101]